MSTKKLRRKRPSWPELKRGEAHYVRLRDDQPPFTYLRPLEITSRSKYCPQKCDEKKGVRQ